MSESDIIIGIDLGTTHSEVAIWEQGQIKVLDVDGSRLMPSCVALDEHDRLLVGSIARNQYVLNPENTVRSVKRLMGSDSQIRLGKQQYTPQEISAFILRKLKKVAEDYLGKNVEKAVITVPAYFTDAQRQATRDAGAIAGLDVVRILNEPTAAAIAYEVDQSEEARTILVYDLGGGTFDVSIVKSEQGVLEVLASHGNNQLGGDDFDALIVDFIVQHLQETQSIDVCSNAIAMAKIFRLAEQAKCQLSDQPFVTIEEAYLTQQDDLPIHLTIELSRMQFEDRIMDCIDQTFDSLHIAMKDAGLTPADIDVFLLAGGSSRIPCVRERLLHEFQLQAHAEIEPDLSVAIGAGRQAAMLAGLQLSTVLLDVTPYTYGSSAIGHLHGEPYPFMYVPILSKNSQLPIEKSEAFMTNYDGQSEVVVTIYQGEDEDALNNVKVGEFIVNGLQDVAKGNLIIVTLHLDLNGVLQVTAVEKSSGLEKSISIKNALSRYENDKLDTARQRLTSVMGQLDASLYQPVETDHALEQKSEEVDQAEQLLDKAEQLLSGLGEDDREDLQNQILLMRTLVESGDIEALDQESKTLKDMLFFMET